MEEQEIDYIQPTRFAGIQKLGELWAHLGNEIDEFLEVALPCVQKNHRGIKPTMDEKIGMAMELADIQVMCNTIIQHTGDLPTCEKDLPERFMERPNFTDQLMYLLETKAKASSEAKAIIRGSYAYSDQLATELVKVIFAAEAVMIKLYEQKEDRTKIRRMVYLKNEERGYYE
ncbi:hypothetical protein [uncultured Anaerovibrio sp.]|uniref:hypothetical protein n=1 Tax=uncultured Anaerovibrio sp. TaxID=361586 RepID=UPI00262437BC|nr:hypothetical protein [uncultured Anaerovibrio sp.]